MVLRSRMRSVLVVLSVGLLLGTGTVTAGASRAVYPDRSDRTEVLRARRGLLRRRHARRRPVRRRGCGRVQDYTRGTIAWSSATGAHEVHGAIWTRYRQANGARGFLGLPLTDEAADAGPRGAVQPLPGRLRLLVRRDRGARGARRHPREVGGAGLEAGFLGYPLTDELLTPDLVGRFTQFQGGSVYWSPGTGARGARRDPVLVGGTGLGARAARLSDLG